MYTYSYATLEVPLDRAHHPPLQLQGAHVRARLTGLLQLQRGARVLHAVRLQLRHQRGRRQRADRLRLL